jgi:hypothetical protein
MAEQPLSRQSSYAERGLEVITVWPCDHGNVLVEHVAVPLGATCHQCGAHPRHFVPKTTFDNCEQYATDGWAWLDKALAALGIETVFEIPEPQDGVADV